MGSLTDYKYSHERLSDAEYDVAAHLLSEASVTRRLTVKYQELGAHPYVQRDLAKIAIVYQQLAEALQQGRLVMLEPSDAGGES